MDLLQSPVRHTGQVRRQELRQEHPQELPKPLGTGAPPCYRPPPTQNGSSIRTRDLGFAADRCYFRSATAQIRPATGRRELAMALIANGNLVEALTFDDVRLKRGLSEFMPSDADVRTRITRGIELNIPIIASAMDTVTEVKM